MVFLSFKERMNQMKRFAIKDYGKAADVFEEIEASSREVDATHVRVEVKAFGVNPYDVSVRLGNMKSFRPLKFPYVLGNDSAGIVTEIGADIKNVAVGDAVIAHSVGGANGEELVLPGHKLIKKPEKMSFAQAAGFVTPWITAYNMVTHLLGNQIGETVMVQGASGSVGSLLVQLLKANGKKVLATASSRNEAYVRELGADEFSAYDKEDAGERFAETADTVIDGTKGGRSSVSGVKIMKTGGNYVALNQLPEDQSKAGNYLHFGPSKDYSDLEALEKLVALYEEDAIQIKMADSLPFTLASVIKAHEMLEGHPPAGKIVIERV